MSAPFNRYLYGGFVVLAVVMLTTGDWMTGVSNIGIALLFDPFDTKQPFNERPKWQQVWLVVHVCALFAALGYGLYTEV